jgi:hypothetical protein
MPCDPFLFILIIAVAGGNDDLRKAVSPAGGIPVAIDDDFPAGIGGI